MNVILILRIFLTAAGVLFLLGDINAYVRQKLTDTIGLLWAFVSVALILTGVVSVPGAREEEYLVVLLLAVCLLLLILKQGGVGSFHEKSGACHAGFPAQSGK